MDTASRLPIAKTQASRALARKPKLMRNLPDRLRRWSKWWRRMDMSGIRSSVHGLKQGFVSDGHYSGEHGLSIRSLAPVLAPFVRRRFTQHSGTRGASRQEPEAPRLFHCSRPVSRMRSGDSLLQSLMRPAPVEVRDELAEHDVEVALFEDDNVIEALASDAPQESLGSRIHQRLRRASPSGFRSRCRTSLPVGPHGQAAPSHRPAPSRPHAQATRRLLRASSTVWSWRAIVPAQRHLALHACSASSTCSASLLPWFASPTRPRRRSILHTRCAARPTCARASPLRVFNPPYRDKLKQCLQVQCEAGSGPYCCQDMNDCMCNQSIAGWPWVGIPQMETPPLPTCPPMGDAGLSTD